MRDLIKALGAVGGFYVMVVIGVVILVVSMPSAWTEGTAQMLSSSGAVVVAGLVAYGILIATGRTSWATVGWPGIGAAARGFAVALAVGMGMAVAALALALILGDASIHVTTGTMGAYAGAAAELGGVLLVAALAEELLFRGYPLARLSSAMGKTVASIVLAVAFAMAHLANPSVSTLALVNIGLASLVLSAAFFTPGALAAAWGLHWGWNMGLSVVDAPVSGVTFDLPALDFSVGGPRWFTGGQFGPEGGLVASVVMMSALVLLTRRHRTVKEKISQ